ncbi:hypothetical protein ACP70R_006526 [Stipagrostis hirtigluma subsp. patula]
MVLLGFGELFRKVWGMPHEQPSSPAPAGVRRRGFSRIAPTSASSSYDSLPFPEEDASACGWCYNLQPRTAPTQIGLRDLRPLDMAPPGVVVPVERSPAGGFLPVHTRTGSSSQDAGDHRVTATRSGRPRDHLAMEVESSPTGQERRVHRGEASITSVAEKLKHLGLKLFHYIVSGSFPSSSPGRPAAVFPYDEDTFDIEAGQPSIDNQTAANSTGGVELRRRGRHNVPTSGTHGAGAEARENLRREAAKELLKQIADALSIPQSLARLVYVGAIPLWTTFLLHRAFYFGDTCFDDGCGGHGGRDGVRISCCHICPLYHCFCSLSSDHSAAPLEGVRAYNGEDVTIVHMYLDDQLHHPQSIEDGCGLSLGSSSRSTYETL